MLFCNVNEEEFEYKQEFKKDGVLYTELRPKNRGHICLGCGTYHTNVKEYKTKKIKHSIYAHQKCIVLFRQRRLICPNYGMTSIEDNPFVSTDKNRISDQTVEIILKDLKRYSNTFAEVAERYGLTTRGVVKIFDRYCQMKRNRLPRVLCIDEIYFSRARKKKYILILLNFKNRAVIDVLKDRDKHTIASYLSNIPREERGRVEYVSIDMNENYRDVIRIYLRKATVIADSFHVVKHVCKVLDNCRKRIMRRFEYHKKSDEYYTLKYYSHLLFDREVSYERKKNRHFRYYTSENEILDMMLLIDPLLKKAYTLVQKYLSFNKRNYNGDLEAVRNDLTALINDYRLAVNEDFHNLAATLENWKEEIIASFSIVNGKRVSNGPIEGRNSLAKKVLKLANGYSNFQRFRNRIMYSLNKLAAHSFKRD